MQLWPKIGLTPLAVVAASGACAQTLPAYPSRALRIIAPYPPGASTDRTARLMGQRLTEAFGQSIVVGNRRGAGGIIAVVLAARAAADGHALSFGKFIRSDCAIWARAVKAAGLRAA